MSSTDTTSLPGDTGGPVFDAPWQAAAFAMTAALIDNGTITARDWAETFSEELHDPGAAQDAGDYYDRWLAALETLLGRKGFADRQMLRDLTEAWHRAARATPHGQPMTLENDPQRRR